jgi:nucleotide-binding universal stress UspA family protein
MPIPASVLEPPAAAGSESATRSPALVSSGPIVVATLGTEDTDAAVRLAWRLAGRTNADVQVLTAIEPVAPVDVAFTVMPPPPGELLAAQRDGQLAQVRAQLCRATSGACDWPVAAADGAADEVIARVATGEGARVVVLGRGRHGAVGRVVSGETVLRILRRVDVPVYAVEADAAALARRVVVAMDFSPYSLHAARVALDLVAPNATVTLAHVWPRVPALGPVAEHWAHAYAVALPGMFARARQELAAPVSVQVETVRLTGPSPGRAVIDFAAASSADLVVSATHGHGFFTRLVLGSVATELLRGAPCSFLCVPGAAATHASSRAGAAAPGLRSQSIASEHWGDALGRLAERMAGQPCALALAEARGAARHEIGALRLASIAYSPPGRVAGFAFGAPGADGPHLTHAVRDVTAVDWLVDASGVVRAVHVAGTEGEATLRFL